MRQGHGTNRSTIIGSIFRLRRFILSDIRKDTGLTPKQIYPTLEALEKQGFLRASPIRGVEAKRQRPLNEYTLVEDPAFKAKLIEEFAPSVRLAEALTKAPEPEALVRARTTLSALGAEIERHVAVPESLVDTKRSALRLHEFQEAIDSISADLEAALYRLALGKNEELPPSVQTEFTRLGNARRQVATLNERLKEMLETKLETQKETASTFREAVALGIATFGSAAVEACSPARLSSYYAQGQEPEWFGSVFETAQSCAHDLEQIPSSDLATLESSLERLFEHKYSEAATREFRQVLAAVRTDVASAFRDDSGSISPKISVLWTLAESAIRYAPDPDTAFWVCKGIENQIPVDPLIASYNSLNFCFLAGNTTQARSWWQSLAENQSFLRRPARSKYPVLLVATAPAQALRRDLLDRMGDVLGSSYACSIVATERIEAISQKPFVVKPSAYNLLTTEESIPLSDGLAMLAERLYVYGPMENVLRRPGVPVITLATGLAGLGLPAKDAWEIADNLRAGSALVVVNSSREVESNLPEQLSDFVDVLAPAERTASIPDTSSGPEPVHEAGAVVYAQKHSGSGLRAIAARAGYSRFYVNADE